MSFADLGLSDELLRAVADSGYGEPTPIQKGVIPSVLMGKDIVGIAQTGTGKTASFVLPMLTRLDRANDYQPFAFVEHVVGRVHGPGECTEDHKS